MKRLLVALGFALLASGASADTMPKGQIACTSLARYEAWNNALRVGDFPELNRMAGVECVRFPFNVSISVLEQEGRLVRFEVRGIELWTARRVLRP